MSNLSHENDLFAMKHGDWLVTIILCIIAAMIVAFVWVALDWSNRLIGIGPTIALSLAVLGLAIWGLARPPRG